MFGNLDILSRIQDTPISVIDVETTGLSPVHNRIIEIAIVQIKNGEIISEYSSLVNPGRKIPGFISIMTGISDSELRTAPFFEEIMPEIRRLLEHTVWGGHNFQFDLGFIKHEFLQCGEENVKPLYLCSLRLSKKLNPLLRRRNLESLCHEYGIHNLRGHRALPDAKATAQILLKMIDSSVRKYAFYTIGDLLNFQFNKQSSSPSDNFSGDIISEIISAPDRAGVYMFYNSKNEIIYIGKAKSLRTRLQSYLGGKSPAKSKKILRFAKKLKYQTTSSELTALFYEAEMIKQILPKHNVMLKSYGNKYFLRIDTLTGFPRIEITNKFDFDGSDYFGVFYSRNVARDFLTIIDRAFQLRECDEKEFDKKRGCFLMHIERCTAPCLNHDSILYSEELKEVYNFLYGNTREVIDRLLNKMKKYVTTQQFEKAAEIKTLTEEILKQVHKSSLLREPINSANLLLVINSGGSKDFVLLKNGRVFIKDYPLTPGERFNNELEHFYYSREYDIHLTDEDIEKLKMMLNWVIKNRSSVKLFYLKDFSSPAELYAEVSRS
ncbi:MAG: GIY-YIG nuclease family protein [Ignavibacteriaceae bacterium]|nr:GIY-YIG nuclease family protein [Ignavibacteriaceae bacterium]